jgi:RecB family exonuclease
VAISYVKNEEKSPSRFLYELNPDFDEKKALNLDEKYENAVLKNFEDKEIAKYENEFEIRYPIYPTTLKTLIECPKKYYFSQILKIENEEESEEEFFGNIFHNSIEEVVKNKNLLNSASEYYETLINEITKRINDKKLLFDVLVKWDDKIKKFCELDFEEMRYSDTFPEKFIKFYFEGKELAARVDRIDIKENEVVLIDYKTSKSAKDSEKYPFEFQTTFYYLWAKEKFPGKEIKTLIWDIATPQKIEGILKLDKLSEVLNDLPKKVREAEDIVYEIDSKEKTKKAEDICRYCEYAVACGRD